ncbi:MAG: GYD family protein [Verrucomicrobia bacterium]|nr:MAG: GYD family protein [Verrucomicrobiota bacterium]
MAKYVSLLQFTDQGIRNVKDSVKRAAAATAEAEKMGAKVTDAFWTMGAYDVVLLLDSPDDETVSAFSLKLGSLGNVKSQTMRAFRREEMESILAKVK